MNELEQLIADRIISSGPITFCEFMRLALYHPEFGYYGKYVRIGKSGGDFYTNADTHPLFGAVVADSVVRCLNQLSPDTPKSIVEFGAGNGKLAFDILTAVAADYASVARSTDYIIVEQSSLAIERQRRILSQFRRVKWMTAEELSKHPIDGVVLSNELVDAFPVHRLRLHDGELGEQFVRVENQQFASDWLMPSSSLISEYVEENQIEVISDQIIEVNLNAREWIKQISEIIKNGFLLTIDYGDTAKRLYTARRMTGTLRCFSSHKLTDDPFSNVGQQDITASVNFSDLITYGARSGFTTLELTNQSEWLIRNGLIQRAEAFERIKQAENDIVSIVGCRQALKDLLVPGGISDNFKVLIQRKELGIN